MKKTFLTAIAVLSLIPFASKAQWSTTSPNTYFTYTGNVGIGTTTYSSLLTVGSASTRGTFNLVGSTADVAAFSISDSRTNGHQFTFYNGASGLGNLDLYDQTAGAYRFTINSLGNIGIGTSSPSCHLQLEGSNNNQFQVTGLGAGYGGTVLANIYSERTVTGTDALLKVGSAFAPNTFYVQDSGNVGIGTTTPHEALSVNGNIRSKEVKVETANWPDYVFKPTYNLPSLTDVKAFVDINHHLPEIPSEQDITKDGLNLGEMNKLLLKKVEELTLYLIEQKQEIDKLKSEVKILNDK